MKYLCIVSASCARASKRTLVRDAIFHRTMDEMSIGTPRAKSSFPLLIRTRARRRCGGRKKDTEGRAREINEPSQGLAICMSIQAPRYLPVQASYHGAVDGWKSSGISYEDAERMDSEFHKLNRNRRSPTPT